VARIELPAAGLRKALSAPVRVKILQGLRAIGFTYIAIDIEGYVAGSMNLGLEQKSVTTS
jgi:PP-loop superfamily ATP-utilizing enzyme